MTFPSGGNLSARLLYLLENVLGSPSPNSLSDVHAAVSAILGPVGAQVSLNDLLTRLTGDGLADLKTLDQKLAGQRSDLADALFSQTNPRYPYFVAVLAKLTSLSDQLDHIQAALGAEPYNTLETANVRGLLYALLQKQGQFGVAPDGSLGTPSVGTLTQEGRRFITWGNVPGTVRTPDNVKLTPVGTWDFYEIYIQTNAGSAIQHDYSIPADTVDPFPVNSWVGLTGAHSLAWSVEAASDARGYIRVPNANCRNFPSSVVLGSNRAVFSTEPPYFTAGGAGNWYLVGDYRDYTVSIVSATVPLNIAIGPDPLGVPPVNYTVFSGDRFVIPVTDGYLWTSSTAPFVMRMCPPEPN